MRTYLAIELNGSKIAEEQELRYKLQKIENEINSTKKRLISLEKQKTELLAIQRQRGA